MAISNTWKLRAGCADMVLNDMRSGAKLSGGMIVKISGLQWIPTDTAAGEAAGCVLGVVGDYYNSGDLVNIERNGRFTVWADSEVQAGKPIMATAGGKVAISDGGAKTIGFAVEKIESGLAGAAEICIV